MQGLEQIFRLHIFQQVAVRATLERRHHILFMIRDAKDHYASGERFFPQLVERFQTVHARHVEIEQDQIGIKRFGKLNALFAIAGFANDGDIGCHADQLFNASTQHRMVVDQQDGCRFLISHGFLLEQL